MDREMASIHTDDGHGWIGGVRDNVEGHGRTSGSVATERLVGEKQACDVGLFLVC